MAEKKNPHALPIQEKWIKLTAKEVKHIFIYYIILFSQLLCCVHERLMTYFLPQRQESNLLSSHHFRLFLAF